MKKTLILIISLALMLFMLTGCSSETLKNAQNGDTDTSIEMRYDLFSGARTKTITLKAQSQINVDIATISGDISVSITGKDGTTAYTGNKMQTGAFVVTVDKDDDYTINVTTKSHSGAYKISW